MSRYTNRRAMHHERRRSQPERRQTDPISGILTGILGSSGTLGSDPESTTSSIIDTPTTTLIPPTNSFSFTSTSTFFPPLTSSDSDRTISGSSTSKDSSTTTSHLLSTNSTTASFTSISSSSSTSGSQSTTSSIISTSVSSSKSGQPTTNPIEIGASLASQVAGTETQSEIITTFTSLSGSVVVTVTSVIHPSASLSSAPAGGSFFANKTQAALVFTFVGLIVVALFTFLGYRFYRTVKRAHADRETEELARSMRYRTQIDDGDADDETAPYGGGMAQIGDGQLPRSRFDSLRRDEDFNVRPSEDTGRSNAIRRRVSSIDRLDPYPSASLQSVPLVYPGVRPSTEMEGHVAASMRSKRSNTTTGGGNHSRSATVPATETPKRSSASIHNYLSLDPLPAPITLPDFFGEDHPCLPDTPLGLEDAQDYQYTPPGRVLKIANE
ncbi:hypothetical protein M422DRAFT_773662 [Sphaerobolus stellatus SS14]|nr:hypothetical protein M422DRAFT_773662 [Sphaerobolus stellatus SS14]